jgi:hypothetical protein
MKNLLAYEPWLKAIRDSVVQNYSIDVEPSWDQIIQSERMVVVFNHSTPLSWLPAISVLATSVIEHGGGHRLPRGVMDHWFYKTPITRPIAEFITQSQTPQNFSELLTSFTANPQTDLVLFPEGANSFFGDPTEIQEFRSSRFIELAVRAKSPILLAVHHGSEKWSFPLQVPPAVGALLTPFSFFFGQNLMRFGSINIPYPASKIPVFNMRLKLIEPELTEEDLLGDKEHKLKALLRESERIKKLMMEMGAAWRKF